MYLYVYFYISSIIFNAFQFCNCLSFYFKVDENKPPISVFSFVERKEGQFKIHIMDIYSPRGDGHIPPLKVTTEFSFPPEAPLDFPIFEHVCLYTHRVGPPL